MIGRSMFITSTLIIYSACFIIGSVEPVHFSDCACSFWVPALKCDFIYLSIYGCIYSSILSISLFFTTLFVHVFIHSFMYLFTVVFIYLSIYLFILFAGSLLMIYFACIISIMRICYQLFIDFSDKIIISLAIFGSAL
jgi:hypothetical protein